MENDEDREVVVGGTGKDEMCNFYLMYWVEGDRVLTGESIHSQLHNENNICFAVDNTCFSPGPPQYYWGSEAALNHIPEKQADQV